MRFHSYQNSFEEAEDKLEYFHEHSLQVLGQMQWDHQSEFQLLVTDDSYQLYVSHLIIQQIIWAFLTALHSWIAGTLSYYCPPLLVEVSGTPT